MLIIRLKKTMHMRQFRSDILIFFDLLVTTNTCLHSVHDSQEKFHLNLEWKRNIQLKIMAWDVHSNMADVVQFMPMTYISIPRGYISQYTQ
jgi:hypothetical protein